MKKIILSAIMACSLSGIAQEQKKEAVVPEKKIVLGITGETAQYGTLALTLEEHESIFGKNFSSVYTFGYGTAGGTQTDLYGFKTNHNGNGLTGGVGIKWYLNSVKAYRGWNLQNNIYASTFRFTDESFKGKLNTLSFFNPTIGYKFRAGSSTYLEPQLGVSWDIITNSSGVANSFDTSNFTVKLGMRIGFGV